MLNDSSSQTAAGCDNRRYCCTKEPSYRQLQEQPSPLSHVCIPSRQQAQSEPSWSSVDTLKAPKTMLEILWCYKMGSTSRQHGCDLQVDQMLKVLGSRWWSLWDGLLNIQSLSARHSHSPISQICRLIGFCRHGQMNHPVRGSPRVR